MMSAITIAADYAFRDYNNPGDPSSGGHVPVNSEVRGVFVIIDSALTSLGINGAITVKTATKAALVSDVAHAADTLAIVYDDNIPANNGIYAKSGPSGAGAWTITNIALPSTFAAELADARARIAAIEPLAGRNWQAGGAGNITKTGLDNVLAGVSAGENLTTGGRNTSLGRAAGRGNTTGLSNVAVGAASALSVSGGSNTTVVGADALGGSSVSLSRTTALGSEALYSSAADEVTGVGFAAARGLTTGLRLTAVGVRAGGRLTIQNDGTFLGWEAGNNSNHVPAANQTAIGSDSYCVAPNQIALGNDDVTSARLFGGVYFREGNFGDIFIGQGAGHTSANGQARVFIGYEAGASCTTPDDIDAVAVGYAACGSASRVRASVVIGTKACQFATNTIDCTVVGDQAGLNMGNLEPVQYVIPSDETKILFAGPVTDGGDTLPSPGLVGATFVGKNAGRYNTIGTNNTGIGDSALGFTTKGIGNTAIGYVAGEGNVKGSRNTWSGCGCRTFQFSGDDNTQGGFSLGNGAGVFATPVAGGSRNTNFGSEAVYVWTGSDTASLGYRSLFNMTDGSGGDVAVGARAGHAVVTGGDNVFIGRDAGFGGGQNTDVQNSIAIGAETVTTADNQVVIGNDDVTEVVLGGVVFTKAQMIALLALV